MDIMSTPERAATSGLSISNPHGSKRGACDRCRGQKLKCLPKNQSQDSPEATCVRCFKAGAICSYRIARRAGTCPGSNAEDAPSSQERRGNGGKKPREGGMAVTGDHRAAFDSKADGRPDRRGAGGGRSGHLLDEYTADQVSEGETEDTTPVHALNPLSLHDTSDMLDGANLDFPAFLASSTATMPWLEKTMPPFSNEAGEAPALEPFRSHYGWDLHHYQAQPIGIQIPLAVPMRNDEQSGDVGVNAYGIPAQTCSTNAQTPGASDEAMDLDLPSTSAQTAPLDPAKDQNARPRRAQPRDRERARVSQSFGIDEVQHRRMQELSELAMELYAQLAANDPEDRQPTAGAMATTFQDQLVGSVLKSSKTFLTLLTSFSAPAPPSPVPPPPSPAISHHHSTSSPSDSDPLRSASALDDDDPAMDEPVPHPHRKLPAGSSDDSKPSPPTDITTVLQLLTCYIRIIHLHSIMYARNLDYILPFLQNAAQRVDSVPPIFPGMQVGGVSLNNFGTFQIKLLLQISVHMLGEIELMLGLPEEYRIGGRKGGGAGVLGASVSGGIVKCVMREGGWRGKRVECVREQLENLRKVLEGAIDF